MTPKDRGEDLSKRVLAKKTSAERLKTIMSSLKFGAELHSQLNAHGEKFQ